MKKTVIAICAVLATLFVVSCTSSKKPAVNISLGKLDDYFSVTSFSIETNAKEKGLGNLDQVTGNLILTVMRNQEDISFKPSSIEEADFTGRTTEHRAFYGDCLAAVRKMVKMEKGAKETFSITFKSEDPCYRSDTDEEKAVARQDVYDALTKQTTLSQIVMEIEIEEDYLGAIKALKDLIDDDDDDYDD
jgi:hypothetical protein